MKFCQNCPKYYIQIVCLLALVTVLSAEYQETATKSMSERFKRQLLSKEKEYLKYKPLSNEMRNFIKRFKRKPKDTKKESRSLDEEKMYVVQNGDIVPFDQMESGRDMDDDKPRSVSNFTVIPLIIPVSLSKDETHDPSNDDPSLFRNNHGHININNEECDTDRNDSPDTNEKYTTLKGPVDTKLLSRVMQDLQRLSVAENEAKLKGEATNCRVEGDWDSVAGGLQIRLEFRNDTHHPDAKLLDREPPMEEGFLTGKNWSISALVPFTKGASSLALNLYTTKGKKLIALFAGECRICEGEETIAGSWVLQRHSKDCKDRQLSQKFIADVLKKNNIRDLQQQNLKELENIASSTAT